jgi:hypothetical protein
MQRVATASIADILRDYFEKEPSELPVFVRQLQNYEIANLTVAIEKYLKQTGAKWKLLGVICDERFDLDKVFMPTSSGGRCSAYQGAVKYCQIALGKEDQFTYVSQGLYLIEASEQKMAILIDENHDFGEGSRLQIMCSDTSFSERVLGKINELGIAHNIFRGKVLAISREEYCSKTFVEILNMPAVSREDIILPPHMLRRVEQHTIDFSTKSGALRKSRRHLKRGLLLFGKPGTGKTLVSHYLINVMPERTTFVVNAHLQTLQQSCKLAQQLQPATIVIEDIDLAGENRDTAKSAALFYLLNQMDSISDDADVLFLLSTNKPEALEAALAQRPGRVDLAVEIPLPDEDSRLKLFVRYSQGLQLEIQGLNKYVQKTKGASAAFIRELLRKAALYASDAHDGKDGEHQEIVVKDEHMASALNDLLFGQEQLTRKFLGFYAGER